MKIVAKLFIRTGVLVCTLAASNAFAANATFYTWEDADGTHATNNRNAVPSDVMERYEPKAPAAVKTDSGKQAGTAVNTGYSIPVTISKTSRHRKKRADKRNDKAIKQVRIGVVTIKTGDPADVTQSRLSPYFVKNIVNSSQEPCYDSIYNASGKEYDLTLCWNGQGGSAVRKIVVK